MPSAIDSHGRGHAIKGWTERTTLEADIARWSRDGRLGICAPCKLVKAIDVDIDTPEVAQAIEHILVKHFDLLPTRRRANSARFLVLVGLVGERGKEVITTKQAVYDAEGKVVEKAELVEVMGHRQQVFLCGTHKDGCRYEWDGGTPDFIPVVTEEELRACLAEIAAAYGTEVVTERQVGTQLIKERMAIDINDDVVQFLDANGWTREKDSDGKVHVTCPWEHEHTPGTGDDRSGTTYFPAGVGGHERGGFKCMHGHCEDRHVGDFLEAIGYVASQFEVVIPEPGTVDAPNFRRGGKNNSEVVKSLVNLLKAVRAPEWFGYDIAFDEFKSSKVVTPFGRREWRTFNDADYPRIKENLDLRIGVEFSVETIKEAVCVRTDERRLDSAITWMENEVPAWDGVKRIDTFYPRCFGTEDSPYTRAVGAYTWTALAGRVLDPGHKVDMVPILASGEGCRKSEAIAEMVPDRDFFVELDLSMEDKELARLMQGKLIAELGEMKGLNKRQAGETKAFITRRHDEWRPVFVETTRVSRRRLLFIATTNEHQMLSDNTGRRRWLPMDITRADTDLIIAERMQLWAEGRERFKAHGRVEFERAEELAREQHERFEEVHPWTDTIHRWLEDVDINGVRQCDVEFTLEEVLTSALDIRKSDKGYKMHSNAVAAILRKFGYEDYRKRVEGHKPRVWRKKLQVQ